MHRIVGVVVLFIAAVAAVPVCFLVLSPSPPGICSSNGRGPPPAPPVDFGTVEFVQNGSYFDYDLTVVSAQAGTAVGQLTVTVRTPSGAPDGNVERILITDASGRTVGVENMTTSAWSQGAGTPLVVGENLTIVSGAALSGDAIYVTVPGECGYTDIVSVPIGPV